VDAALRAAARTKGAREGLAKVLLAVEPGQLRLAAAVKAANEAVAEVLHGAVIEEGEAHDEELCEVDMAYYEQSRG